MSRAKKPLGFSLWETWADALGWEPSPRRSMAFWWYRNVISGVRIMVKFADYDNDKDGWYEEILRRHDIARGLGLRTLLCIDWFNRAGNAGSYHKSVIRPPLNQIPNVVRNIIADFSPDMIEVCNEPYYAKRDVDRVNHKEYADLVDAYILGASGFHGKIVASQPNEEFKKPSPNGLHDAWVWEAEWGPGMIEGDHSAILHEYQTVEELVDAVDDWAGDRPIGYVWPIFETELSPGGRAHPDHVDSAYDMCFGFTKWAKSKKLPYAFLAMGGEKPNASWGISTRLIDQNGVITKAGMGVLDAMGIEPPNTPPPPDPDDDIEYEASRWAYRAIRRAGQLPDVTSARKDRRFKKYLKKWERAWRD